LEPLKGLAGDARAQSPQITAKASDDSSASMEDPLDAPAKGAGGKRRKGKKRGKRPSAKPSAPQMGRFAHATAFDQLQDTAEESEEEVLQYDDLPSSAATMSAPVAADTDGVSGNKVTAVDWETPFWRRQGGRAMPSFESDFWAVYGNKLRVFGTQEGVCLLDE